MKKLKVVYVIMVGDLFHLGHLKMLQEAKELGDILIAGVMVDRAVEEFKRKPVIPFEDRIEIIKNIKCVDLVVVQQHRDPTDVLQMLAKTPLKPDVLVHGDDWAEIPGEKFMKSINRSVVKLRYHDECPSTTKIINKIKQEYSLITTDKFSVKK